MAGYYYLKITGQKSGVVKSGSTAKGYVDQIEAETLAWDFVSPRDPATGLPSGKRLHKPFRFTAKYSKASPILQQMLATNENITSAELTALSHGGQALGQATAAGGGAQKYLTVKLTNATVAEYRLLTETVGTGGAGGSSLATGHQLTEEVALTYQKIEFTWVNGGVTFADDWTQPSV